MASTPATTVERSTGTTPQGPSAAQITFVRRDLAGVLSPGAISARGLALAAQIRAVFYRFETGTLQVVWTVRATVGRRTRSATLVNLRRTLTGTGLTTLQLTLTPGGRALLRHAHAATLVDRATYSSAAIGAVSVARTVKLRR